jgi:electron transfer flavoprotein alpha subunit
MTVLVISEHDNNCLHHATFTTITAAKKLNSRVNAIVIGNQCQEVVNQIAKVNGVDHVLVCDHDVYQDHLAENLAQVVAKLAHNYTHILAPATTFGKDLLPRVAGLLDVFQISDIIKIIDERTFIRPIYAGNAFATVQSKDDIKLITVRTTSFEPATIGETTANSSLLQDVIPANNTTLVGRTLHQMERPELTSAKIVISGGRGFQSAANFKLLEKIADRLGAAVGASRAAVDAGYVPNDYQVGQTGKVVAPDLYIALGISGAIQHIAGMKESKIVVAINKDPDAPIFQVADYGLVADLFQVIPELEQELTKLGYHPKLT